MKKLLTVCLTPLWLIGFVLGFVVRPLFVGGVAGYFWLELKSYDELLKKHGPLPEKTE